MDKPRFFDTIASGEPANPGRNRMSKMVASLWLSLALATMPALAQESVDLELVLLADASHSIDDDEIAFQRQGYAAAITHTDVLSAIVSGFDGRIAVTYVEWGTSGSQEVVVPWTVIDGAASAEAFAAELVAKPRMAFGRNAIGAAIKAGQALIENNSIDGHRKVIDLSADSANSYSGPAIETARDEAIAAGITINGLAVLCRICSGRPSYYDLEGAFARRIIGGPGSFVVTADGKTSFAEAVRRKLVLEIAENRLSTPAGG
jgi:hypothetical protein